MGNSNLEKTEKTLRSLAKRYENVKYSVGLAVLFLMKGTSAFSDTNMIQEVEKQKDIVTDIKNEKVELKETKKSTQATKKMKASWVNMQFGANDMYSNLFTSSKTKVGKTSIVKSEKTVLVASSDNSTSLPMFAKLLSDIEESTETRTEVLSSIANNENIPSETPTPTIEEIKAGKENLKNSVENLQNKIDTARRENNKEINGLRLELIQLMEQGDHVTKSPWSSWQYGMNYFYNDWRGTFRGRGDKKQKYPYEGIFERSDDIFLRSISSDSVHYDSYTSAANALGKYRHPATTSSNQVRSRYGLENSEIRYEPVVRIELGASVKPKEIVKSPVTVTPPRIQVNTVTPLSTPAAPSAPNPPTIEIDKFNPVAPNPITVDLPTPPTFNIKLGSYRNHMEQDVPPHEDGGRLSGTGKSYSTNDDVTINGASLSRTIIYAWKDPSPALGGASGFDSALLKAYFDYTRKSNPANTSGGKTATLEGEITIDSVNTLTEAQITAERNAGRKWNTQPFLVGGSRVATLDNAGAKGGTILNRAKDHLLLVLKFKMIEMQLLVEKER